MAVNTSSRRCASRPLLSWGPVGLLHTSSLRISRVSADTRPGRKRACVNAARCRATEAAQGSIGYVVEGSITATAEHSGPGRGFRSCERAESHGCTNVPTRAALSRPGAARPSPRDGAIDCVGAARGPRFSGSGGELHLFCEHPRSPRPRRRAARRAAGSAESTCRIAPAARSRATSAASRQFQRESGAVTRAPGASRGPGSIELRRSPKGAQIRRAPISRTQPANSRRLGAAASAQATQAHTLLMGEPRCSGAARPGMNTGEDQ